MTSRSNRLPLVLEPLVVPLPLVLEPLVGPLPLVVEPLVVRLDLSASITSSVEPGGDHGST